MVIVILPLNQSQGLPKVTGQSAYHMVGFLSQGGGGARAPLKQFAPLKLGLKTIEN